MRSLHRLQYCILALMGILHLGAAWNGDYVPIANVKRNIGANQALTYHFPLAAHTHPGGFKQQVATIPCRFQQRFGIRAITWPSVRSRSVMLRETEGDPSVGADADEETTTPSLWGRVNGYFVQDKKDDGLTFRQRLANMGLATVLSYGMISNLSYAILIALSWYAFAAKTKLSPLAPGQWKPFLGVYTGFWVFNNIIRPLRVGLSIAITPSLDKLVLFFQNRLKLSKPLAITVTVIFVNIIGTILLMVGGIALASILAGVPIYPPRGIA